MKTRLGTLLRLEEKWLLAGIGVWISTYLIVRYFCIEPGDAGLRWDAAWYAEAASRGYTFNGNPNYMQVVGFMPLFPSVIALLSKSGLSINLLMSVVPIICVSLAIPLLFRAIETLTSSAEALAICLLFMASPFSLFFLNGYGESLYLLLMGLFFFSLVRLRSHLLAAIFAGLASGVRPYAMVFFGVFLLWCLLKEAPGNHAIRRTLRSAFQYGPLFLGGFFLTGLYYYYSFEDLFLYRNAMIAWGYDLTSDGPGSLIDHFRTQLMAFNIDFVALRSGSPPEIGKLQFLAFLALGVPLMRKIPFLLAVYGVLLVAFILTVSEGTATIGRHMATNIALPALVVCAVRGVNISWWHDTAAISKPAFGIRGWLLLVGICLIGLALQLYLDSVFFASRWVG